VPLKAAKPVPTINGAIGNEFSLRNFEPGFGIELRRIRRQRPQWTLTR
jgi:hypothetical protein